MKAVSLNSPLKIGMRSVPMAERRNANEVLIKVRALGICGSDIGAFRGSNPLVSYPRILGHEIGGEVLEVGESASGIAVGNKVVVEPYLPCRECYSCSMGRTNCCEQLKVLGVHIDGGMAEYFSHPVEWVHRVPDEMEWKQVAMIEPLTIALHANHQAKVKTREHVLIIGAGTIGLLAAQVAQVYGAIPIVMDIEKERLKLARAIGMPYTLQPGEGNVIEQVQEITHGRMAEAVIEASGAKSAIYSIFDYVSYAGRIVLVGWPKGETPLATAVITKKELTVAGSRNSVGEFAEATQLIQSKQVQLEPLISRVVTLEGIPDAVESIASHPDKFMKVVAVL
ncbi:2-desacetyl-2-hydroxyethyl bacteriochlorophyllide A dehydrogenase [Sporomusaceae bacterium BoRhaA]|uniref:zinc-binding alcohol dehydrogenase family protein n=1 Tax=Pelorhabdus rhamnosifermentans TaxID=2772457 RepID=UPI001C06472E|nr:zinc-binding alcohol dehydrogenase family protein [Pelorhabdus rhamnosifermentans]MBU2703382.1 2-desacetyl-2-hydroxyethyl bacteriochlorophyllide A dehydrogenase [Pelorhabdus rhamnosifermentans]